jgi:hypothetical protein
MSRAYSRVYRGFTTLRRLAPSRCGYGIHSEVERIIVRFLTISQLSFLWEVSGHVTWLILIIDKSFLRQRENRPSCRARNVAWRGVHVIVLCTAPLIVVTHRVVLSCDLHF